MSDETIMEDIETLNKINEDLLSDLARLQTKCKLVAVQVRALANKVCTARPDYAEKINLIVEGMNSNLARLTGEMQ